MAKYIIEIPDVAVASMDGDMIFSVEPKDNSWEGMHYVLRIGEEDVSIYTEPDCKVVEDEVWELARIVTSMNMQDYMQCFGEDAALVMTYQEAKSKYDAWKKEKEKIHVGDEVTYGDRIGVVVRIDTEGSGVNVVGRDGCTAYIGMADVAKTGRHFPDVKKLLERMKAE